VEAAIASSWDARSGRPELCRLGASAGGGFAWSGFANGGTDEFDELRFCLTQISATSALSWATRVSYAAWRSRSETMTD